MNCDCSTIEMWLFNKWIVTVQQMRCGCSTNEVWLLNNWSVTIQQMKWLLNRWNERWTNEIKVQQMKWLLNKWTDCSTDWSRNEAWLFAKWTVTVQQSQRLFKKWSVTVQQMQCKCTSKQSRVHHDQTTPRPMEVRQNDIGSGRKGKYKQCWGRSSIDFSTSCCYSGSAWLTSIAKCENILNYTL